MKKYISKTAIIIISLVISACVTHGRNFDMEKVDALIPGQSTIADATEKLGKPVMKKSGENGEAIYGWRYISSTPMGSKGQVVTISFSNDGKMIKVLKKSEVNQ